MELVNLLLSKIFQVTQVKRVHDRVEQHAISVYVNCVAMLCEDQNWNKKANLSESVSVRESVQ